MDTYNVRISYMDTDDNLCYFMNEGFNAVKDATEWVSDKLGRIMMHWGEVNPNGLIVNAEIFNDEGSFSDLYELKCGL